MMMMMMMMMMTTLKGCMTAVLDLLPRFGFFTDLMYQAILCLQEIRLFPVEHVMQLQMSSGRDGPVS